MVEWLQQNLIYIVMFAIIIFFVVWMVISNKKRKKQEEEAQNLINAVGPGNKVKTIGGICGIVVEVDNEENTFILETGSETSGKSYIKFDRQAIYQTDAVVEKDKPADSNDKTEEAEKVEAPAEEVKESTEEE